MAALHDECDVVLFIAVFHHLRTGVVVALLSVGVKPVEEQPAALCLLVVGRVAHVEQDVRI